MTHFLRHFASASTAGAHFHFTGRPGSGKTVALQQLVTESLLDGTRVTVASPTFPAEFDFARPWANVNRDASLQSVLALLTGQWAYTRDGISPNLIVLDGIDYIAQNAEPKTSAKIIEAVRRLSEHENVTLAIASQQNPVDTLRAMGLTTPNVFAFAFDGDQGRFEGEFTNADKTFTDRFVVPPLTAADHQERLDFIFGD